MSKNINNNSLYANVKISVKTVDIIIIIGIIALIACTFFGIKTAEVNAEKEDNSIEYEYYLTSNYPSLGLSTNVT